MRAAQKRDHLRHLARLEYPLLRVDGGALLPHLLDADAAPFGLGVRRALGHCGAHPARQHGVGGDSERPGVLRHRSRQPDHPMLGRGIRAAGTFRLLAGGGTRKHDPAVAALAHADVVEADGYQLRRAA